MKINGNEVNQSTCSPTCIGYFDDNSTLLDGFAIERVRDRIAANLQEQQETPSSHSDKKHRRQNSPPTLEGTPGSSSHSDKKHRRQNSLPTLEEAPGSSEHNARSTERVRSAGRRRPPSPQLSSCASTLSTRIIGGGLDRIEVKRLNNTASGYARRGNEKKALKTYKQALRLTKLEVARIQHQLQNAKDQPDSVKKAVHVLLHDEWTKVALAIADIRTMMAIIYERIGHYEKAVLCCNEARDVYERQYTFDKKHHCENSTAKDNAARMSHMALKMEDASDSFKLRQDLHAYSLKTHHQIMTTADNAVRDMLYEALFDKLSAALGLELESLGHNHPQVAETLTFLSKLYLERSDTPKALKTMERAVSIAEVSLGAMHPKTGEKYHDIARMYETVERDKTDTVNALHFYEKAIETYKECDGDHSRLLGSILNDVGVLHIQREQYDVAVQKLSDALASYESSIGDEKGMSADTVQVWRNLAECYALRKEWESATMAFTSALDVQRDARKLYDTALQGGSIMPMTPIISDESIGDTLKRLGKSYAAQKKYEISYGTLLEALTIFQTAYDNAQEITKKAPGCDVSEKQDQVASVIFCIAEVKEADKKYGEAIRLYEEALQLRIFSDKQRPEGKKSNHVHCAMCMAGIGSIRIAKKQYKLAFKAFNKAIQCTRRQSKKIRVQQSVKLLRPRLTAFLFSYRSRRIPSYRSNAMGKIKGSCEENGGRGFSEKNKNNRGWSGN
jgi:tetratricopeptide (TPR) repeat protein